MDHHSTVKVKEEDEDFAAEIFNYFSPTIQDDTMEPFEMCPHEDPIMEPIPSDCVLHNGEGSQVLPESGPGGLLHSVLNQEATDPFVMCPDEELIMKPMPPPCVLHRDASQVPEELKRKLNHFILFCIKRARSPLRCALMKWRLSLSWVLEPMKRAGKPFFSVILTKSHVKHPYQVTIPSEMAKELPCTTFPVVLRYFGKNFEEEET